MWKWGFSFENTCAGTAGLAEAFPIPAWPHLPDGAQQLPIAEHDHQERYDEAEDKQADEVRDVIRRLGRPVDRAGGPGALGPIAAPAKEWRQRPDEGVDPGQGDAQGDLTVVGRVGLGGGHHGAVALIGKDSQGDQGHDAYKVDRAHTYMVTITCSIDSGTLYVGIYCVKVNRVKYNTQANITP